METCPAQLHAPETSTLHSARRSAVTHVQRLYKTSSHNILCLLHCISPLCVCVLLMCLAVCVVFWRRPRGLGWERPRSLGVWQCNVVKPNGYIVYCLSHSWPRNWWDKKHKSNIVASRYRQRECVRVHVSLSERMWQRMFGTVSRTGCVDVDKWECVSMCLHGERSFEWWGDPGSSCHTNRWTVTLI